MRTILLALAFVCAVALAQPAGQGAKVPAGQAARRWTQPKTTWGDPDLEGVWTSDNNFSIPLERPAEVADKVVLEGTELQASSLIIDPPNGRLPAFTPLARQRAAAAEARGASGPADSWADRSLWDRCIAVGLPYVMFPTGY